MAADAGHDPVKSLQVGTFDAAAKLILRVQRCQFHLQLNVQGYVGKRYQRAPVARQIRGILNAPDVREAQRLLNVVLKEWQVSHPQLALCAEINLPEGDLSSHFSGL